MITIKFNNHIKLFEKKNIRLVKTRRSKKHGF